MLASPAPQYARESSTSTMSEVKRKIIALFRSRSAPEDDGRIDDRDRDPEDRQRLRRSRKDGEDGRDRRPSGAGPPRRRSAEFEKDRERERERDRERRYESRSSLSKNSERRKSSTPAPVGPSRIRPALTEWPPRELAGNASLSQGKAMELICTGAPVFHGQRRPIPHASDAYYRLYAYCDGTGDPDSDIAEPYHAAFTANTLRMVGSEPAKHPRETLEHPSMAFAYGTRSGTTTLNHWVSLSDHPCPTIQLRDPGIKPRPIPMATILKRLIYLERGFEDEYPELMYKNLYKDLLKDPDRYTSPHKGTEKQIADLITVLSRSEWIDFSQPKNQVVAKFFTNATYTDQDRYRSFFHQLLLSMELDLRIRSKQHASWAQEKLVAQLPPQIAWDLAVARRWRECMHIERAETGSDKEQSEFDTSFTLFLANISAVRYRLTLKKRQVKAIRKFARSMKWPNLARVDEVLRERDPSAPDLELLSSDTMSYFTGMILPGSTLPFLIMNSLIDCDADASALTALTHMQPACGFQYKSSTYWSSTSIVGKVLAPTCQEIGGWIGPARPAPDLSRTQIARIRQRRPKQIVSITDAETMMIRSDALGPPPPNTPVPNINYPVTEYALLLPDGDDIVDTVRIEKLALKPVSNQSSPSSPDVNPLTTSRSRPTSSRDGKKTPPTGSDTTKPTTFDACVLFAISGKSWPLRLSYDVSFISSYPCAHGPHPLFFDYVFKTVKVDEILTIRDWGGLNGSTSYSFSSRSRSKSRDRSDRIPRSYGEEEAEQMRIREMEALEEREKELAEADEREKVLCIEAFGVADNEVLARAWCAHWGLSAVIADLERTCMGCAVREAFAAAVNVVVLVEGTGERHVVGG